MRKSIKGLAFLLAMILSIGVLSGCTSKDAKAAKTTVDNFLSTLQEGNLEDASQYCTEDVLKDTGINELQSLSTVFYKSLGLSKKDLSKKTQESVTSFTNKLTKAFVTEYSVQSAEISEKKATVVADVTYGFDPDALSSIDISSKTKKLTSSYLSKNKKKLTQLYINKGETALQKKVYSDILPDVLDEYYQAIEDTGSAKQELQFKLKKSDGEWTITGVYSSGSTSSKSKSKASSENASSSSSDSDSSTSSNSSDN
jgi:hypothetical protein